MPCIHLHSAYRVYDMKRTNIVLDDALVSQGLKLTGLKTQKDLVHHALLQLVRRESQVGLLKLRGSVTWDGDLSEMRRGRTV
jgi:Arc/MetJ family transcription regulator